MTFSAFAQHLQKLESTPSRLDMTALLASLFGELETSEISQACYLMQGSLTPAYISLEFNLSVKMVLRALAELVELEQEDAVQGDLFGDDAATREQYVTALYKKLGDVGLVAEKVVAQKPNNDSPSILDVHHSLSEIARDGGEGSQARKVQGLVKLLRSVDSVSAKYLVRVVIGKLRLGFSTMTLLDALSWTVVGDKSETKALEAAYQKRADVGVLAEAYLPQASDSVAQRLASLATMPVEVGVPIVPALCQRLNSATEIVEKMDVVIAEPKYDGLRVQIHVLEDDTVRAFTRNLDDISHMFPELQQARDQLRCKNCIIDAEAIGYNKETGSLVTFQETITRRRKHDVAAKAIEVPLRFYVFDVLSLDDSDFLKKKLRERKDVLKSLFSDSEVFIHTPYITSNDPVEIRTFHEQQLAEGLEGAVMKQLDSPYASGRKGWYWVKIKEEEGTSGKLSDTLDCVVMGYYVGRGKRTEFGIGALLVGVLREDEQIVSIAKIGTGLSDEQLRDMKRRGDVLQAGEQPTQYVTHKDLTPDVWMEPELVIEVAADEITTSPTHAAGVALRFPRLIKVREDKGVEQATTLAEAKRL